MKRKKLKSRLQIKMAETGMAIHGRMTLQAKNEMTGERSGKTIDLERIRTDKPILLQLFCSEVVIICRSLDQI